MPASPRAAWAVRGPGGLTGHRSSHLAVPPAPAATHSFTCCPTAWGPRAPQQPRVGPGRGGEGRGATVGSQSRKLWGQGSTWGAKRPPCPHIPPSGTKPRLEGSRALPEPSQQNLLTSRPNCRWNLNPHAPLPVGGVAAGRWVSPGAPILVGGAAWKRSPALWPVSREAEGRGHTKHRGAARPGAQGHEGDGVGSGQATRRAQP